MSLKHWQQMGGVTINEDLLIDKSIHRTINSRSAVLKVLDFFLLFLLVELSREIYEFLFLLLTIYSVLCPALAMLILNILN